MFQRSDSSLWIPLKPLEEEADPEKAQKLEEMIVILREVRIDLTQRSSAESRPSCDTPRNACGVLSLGQLSYLLS